MTEEKMVDQNLITTRIIEDRPGHNVIYSAATGNDGRIYLGLSAEMDSPGTFARLICYDPAADRFEDIADLGKIIKQPKDSLRHPHSKIHTSICIGKDGKVFAATHMTAPPAGEDFYHYWHVYNDPARCFQGSHLIIYDPNTKQVEDFGVVSPKGGCRWLTYNPEMEELYLTSFLTAHFIVVKLKTGEVKDLGRVSQYDFMGPCYSACGYAYTTDCHGFLLRYSPKDETIDKLPIKIPNSPWRNSDGNGVFHFVPGPDKIKLYGVSAIGQNVFEFDPTAGEYGQIRDYGTLYDEDKMGEYPVNIPLPRTMTAGQDGKIYIGTKNYVSGKAGAHIASIDIASGEKTYYGIMQIDGFARINTPVAAAVGHDGNVYFAAEQPGKNSPLQLVIFNPAGIKKKLPESYKTRYQITVAEQSSPFEYSYYYPSREHNSIFVTTGNFFAQELGLCGRTPHIPRNECAVTALVIGNNGILFGATSGSKSHLFAYLPLTKRFLPLNTFGEAQSRCRNIVADGQGRIYMSTMAYGKDSTDGHLYLYNAPENELVFNSLDDRDKGEFTLLFKPAHLISPGLASIDDLGAPVQGEGILAMTIDNARNHIYGLTYPGGKFFIYDIASRKTTVKNIYDDHIGKKNNISRAMICADGNVYFSGRHGCIIKYCPDEDVFVETKMKIPVGAGREYLNTISALTRADDGMIYGGTYADGYLFTFNPADEKLVNLGKPSIESHIRGITAGLDGRIWGLCGADDELVHLFRYDPSDRNLEDSGMVRAKMPKTWIMHKADVLITGADGELYIGESDAISHLFIYYPPLKKKNNDISLTKGVV
jgi:outer membrane protein assembly factor BamB